MGGLFVKAKKQCWNCIYQDMPQESFLGECTYFVRKGMSPKEIPSDIVDRGCKYWKLKQGKSNKSKSAIGPILTLFDGKVLP